MHKKRSNDAWTRRLEAELQSAQPKPVYAYIGRVVTGLGNIYTDLASDFGYHAKPNAVPGYVCVVPRITSKLLKSFEVSLKGLITLPYEVHELADYLPEVAETLSETARQSVTLTDLVPTAKLAAIALKMPKYSDTGRLLANDRYALSKYRWNRRGAGQPDINLGGIEIAAGQDASFLTALEHLVTKQEIVAGPVSLVQFSEPQMIS